MESTPLLWQADTKLHATFYLLIIIVIIFPTSAFVHLISCSDHTDSLKLPQQGSRPMFTVGSKIFRLSGVELPYDEYRDQSEMETVNYHMLFKPAVEQWLRAARKKSYARIKKAVELDKVRNLNCIILWDNILGKIKGYHLQKMFALIVLQLM